MSTPTLHVFIDTNVFLSFFSYTNDDIEQLTKLVGSIKSGATKLYLPRQVVSEFARNREKRIKESIEKIAAATLPKSLPRLMTDYPSASQFLQAIQDVEAARDALVSAVREDARNRTLAADSLFEAIAEASGVIELSSELLARARDRQALGNPPGKSTGIGDELNWEALLEHVEEGADLHIVSKDGDFRSVLFGTSPHPFLANEWRTRKGGQLVLHPEIKTLLKAWFPAIQLKIDKDKNSAIEALEQSWNFASTHQAIERLEPFIELLTSSDVQRLARAAQENSQIKWIAEDEDVRGFYRRILPQVLGEFPKDLRDEMVELFDLEAPVPASPV